MPFFLHMIVRGQTDIFWGTTDSAHVLSSLEDSADAKVGNFDAEVVSSSNTK